MARPRTKYMLLRDGVETGKILYSNDIYAIFGIDQRNINKYIDNRHYMNRWSFMPVYEECNKKNLDFSEWNSASKDILNSLNNVYYVVFKKKRDIAHYEIEAEVLNVNASSEDEAREKADIILDNTYQIIDVTKDARALELVRGIKIGKLQVKSSP